MGQSEHRDVRGSNSSATANNPSSSMGCTWIAAGLAAALLMVFGISAVRWLGFGSDRIANQNAAKGTPSPQSTNAEPQPTAATGGGGTGATPDILDGATFAMGKIDVRENADPKAETSIVLEISIAKRPHEDVDTNQLKVQVFFYDTVNDREIRLTDAEVNYKWLTSRQWFEERPEILEVSYFRPRRSAASGNSRKYLGYIVRLYFNNKLQAVAADPTNLLNIFPPARVLSPKASGSVPASAN